MQIIWQKSIWLIGWILKGTTTPLQKVYESNRNEGILRTDQIFRTGVSASDAVFNDIRRTNLFFGGGGGDHEYNSSVVNPTDRTRN